METFLKKVAQSLREELNGDFSRTALIFPTKRAGLFFDEYLMEGSSAPLWRPDYLTINELFDSLSPLKADDPIKTVCRIFKICKELNTTASELDVFYSWGEQILKDFDDVDKNLVDAKPFFSNLAEIKKLELPNLEEEQLKNLEHIFNDGTPIRKDFNTLWSSLYKIYSELNRQLAENGEAYYGARCRKVIEGIRSEKIKLGDRYDHYAFVGFNVLLGTERELFETVRDQHLGFFYWDINQQMADKASVFKFCKRLNDNLEKFPMPANFEDKATELPNIKFKAANSNNIQARYAENWLESHLTEKQHRTAIIVCDENQLEPLIFSVPKSIKSKESAEREISINITKGFPLSHTPAFAAIMKILGTWQDEQKPSPSERLKILAEEMNKEAIKDQKTENRSSWLGFMSSEAYFQCYKIINKFRLLLDEGLTEISSSLLARLMEQVLRAQSIPFHGEPLQGLQIMGMLETRNLDFENILMLNVNEGILPKANKDHSFIPYDLRKAFGLLTKEDESEVYAYNFFRLFKHAKSITMVYNDAVNNDNQGEMSRFMRLLLACTDWKKHIQQERLKEYSECKPSTMSGIGAQPALTGKLVSISPTQMEEYMKCPLKFYFKKLAGLNELIEPEDILPANTFGSIFHEAAQLSFKDLTKDTPEEKHGKLVSKDKITELLKDTAKLKKIISDSFAAVSKQENERNGTDFEYKPEEHPIEAGVLQNYLKKLLKADSDFEELYIVEMEKWRDTEIVTGIRSGGYIDRLDIVKENGKYRMRVVDYKTGSYKEGKTKFKSLDEIFECQNGEKDYVFQTFLYSLVVHDNKEIKRKLPISPVLIFLRNLSDADSECVIKGPDADGKGSEPVTDFFNQFGEDYKQQLKGLIEKIQQEPFSRAADDKKTAGNCSIYCPFTRLCNVTVKEW